MNELNVLNAKATLIGVIITSSILPPGQKLMSHV